MLLQVVEGIDGSVPEVLVFDDAVGTFHKGVIVAGVAHTDADADFLELLGVVATSILRAFVGMVDEFLGVVFNAPLGEGEGQSIEVGLGKHPLGGVVTDDLSGVEVFNEHDVTELSGDLEVENIADPDLVNVKEHGAMQEVERSVGGAWIGGFMKFQPRKRLIAVAHAVLDEGIAPDKIGLEFVVDFL